MKKKKKKIGKKSHNRSDNNVALSSHHLPLCYCQLSALLANLFEALTCANCTYSTAKQTVLGAIDAGFDMMAGTGAMGPDVVGEKM